MASHNAKYYRKKINKSAQRDNKRIDDMFSRQSSIDNQSSNDISLEAIESDRPDPGKGHTESTDPPLLSQSQCSIKQV